MKKILFYLSLFVLFVFLGCATSASKDELQLINLSEKSNSLPEIKKLFKQKKLNVEAVDKDGYFPLYNAATAGNVKVVKFLIKKGADINQRLEKRGGCRRTPLIGVIKNYYGLDEDKVLEIVKILIKNGAYMDVEDCRERTPLEWALRNREFKVAKYLIENGANIRKFDLWYSLEVLHDLNKNSVSYKKLRDIAILMLKKGASPIDMEGDNLLVNAVRIGDIKLVKAFIKYDKEIIDYPNGLYHSTPLMEAGQLHRDEIIKILILAGANPHAKASSDGDEAINYIHNKLLRKFALNPKKYRYLIENPYLYYPNLSKYTKKDNSVKKIIEAIKNKDINKLKKLNYKKYSNAIFKDIKYYLDTAKPSEKEYNQYRKFLFKLILLTKSAPIDIQRIVLENDDNCKKLRIFLDNNVVLNKKVIPIKAFSCKYIDNMSYIKKLIKIGIKPKIENLATILKNDVGIYNSLIKTDVIEKNNKFVLKSNFKKANIYKKFIFRKLNFLITQFNYKDHTQYNSFDIIYPLLASIYHDENTELLKFNLIKYLINKDIIDPYFYYEYYAGEGIDKTVYLMDKLYEYLKLLPSYFSYDIKQKYQDLVLTFNRTTTPIIFFTQKNNFIMLNFLLNPKECIPPSTAVYDTQKGIIKYHWYCDIYKKNNDLNVNARDNLDHTPLYYAIKNQNIKITNLLLEYGASPNYFDSLALAVKVNNLEIAKLLLQYNVNIKETKALDIALENRNNKFVNYLLNIPNFPLKQSNLDTAVKYADFKYVKILLNKGLKPTGKTFEYALEREDKKIINYLYTHYKIPINSTTLATIINKDLFSLYKKIIKNEAISCDKIEKVAYLNNKKYINAMKKYQSKKIKKCIKNIKYNIVDYLQDYTNPNFYDIYNNALKTLKMLYSKYYNRTIPQKFKNEIVSLYDKYSLKHTEYLKRRANEPKSISIKNCYNGADNARCCFVEINGEDYGSICYEWDSTYKVYNIFPVFGSKITNSGNYNPYLKEIYTAECGYSEAYTVHSISDALYKLVNCVANGHY